MKFFIVINGRESRLKPLTPISHLSEKTYLIRLGFHKKDN